MKEEKYYITKFLNKNIDFKFIEEPNIKENLVLIDVVIQKIKDIDNNFELYYHKLHRQGILYLINELKIYLNYIPTNILRNELTPIHNYIEITNYIAKNYNLINQNNNRKKEESIELLGKEYSKSLNILNYFINIELNIKKNIFYKGEK